MEGQEGVTPPGPSAQPVPKDQAVLGEVLDQVLHSANHGCRVATIACTTEHTAGLPDQPRSLSMHWVCAPRWRSSRSTGSLS